MSFVVIKTSTLVCDVRVRIASEKKQLAPPLLGKSFFVDRSIFAFSWFKTPYHTPEGLYLIIEIIIFKIRLPISLKIS